MNTLMDMYTKCGFVERALEVFISLKCVPSTVTYVCALKACAGLANERASEKESCLEKGLSIHQELKKLGACSDVNVGNTLLEMYIKCGSMVEAQELFETLPEKDTVTWTCLILGYVASGESRKALEVFMSMECEADAVAFVAALQACGGTGALSVGRSVHGMSVRGGVDQEQVVGNALVDMYAKCSNMEKAEETVNRMSYSPSTVTWNALLSGYSSLGRTSSVFALADWMQRAGVELNGVSLVCILTACNHAGMVNEAKRYFESMKSRYGVRPSREHFTCMVDMLGRANRLEEAVAMLAGMTTEADFVTWRALLGACRKWNNAEIGKVAFDSLVAHNRNDPAAYVLMREIYDSLAMQR